MIGQRPYYCVRCKDLQIVSKTDFYRKDDLVPCPYCGDPARRENVVRERYKIVNPLPKLTEDGLTTEEQEVVREWRTRGFHMQDCLRWIEGRRYTWEEFDAGLPPEQRRLTKP